MKPLHRTKRILAYAGLLIGVLIFHAYALHIDEEAQRDMRTLTAERQA